MTNVFRYEKVRGLLYVVPRGFVSPGVVVLCQWKTTETRYADREWDDDEMAAFEDAVHTHGAELRTVRDEVGTRTIYEVVRYYGHWKKYIFVASFLPAIDR
jgi:hypothetical protein